MSAIDLHVQSMFSFDAHGRIDGTNDWVEHPLAKVHIAFSVDADRPAVRFGQSIDDSERWSARVAELAASNPPPSDQASLIRWRDQLARLLEPLGTFEINGGPAYAADRVPDQPPAGTALVTPGNTDALDRNHADWRADVPHQQPMAVALLGEHAVAVCATVRKPPAHAGAKFGYQAGLETSPNARRRGYAVLAVNAWCHAVAASGFVPVYSTSWDNVASQRVARRCDLRFLGSDISVI